MEPTDFRSTDRPREQAILLENLRSTENDAFEDLARRVLDDPNVDMNLVYPHPMNKTLLDMSCCEGRVDFVERLLKRGANANRINETHNRAPIHFAAEAGHADVLKCLLNEKRTNPDLEVAQQTALHIAVRNDNPGCVRVLLENGANPNIANSKGLTPIHIAAASGKREMVQLILNESTKFPLNLDGFKDLRKKTTREVLIQKWADLELPAIKEMKNIDVDEIRRACLDANDETRFLDNLRRINDDQLGDIDELVNTATKRNFPQGIEQLFKRGGLVHPKTYEIAQLAVELGHHDVLKKFLAIDSKLGNKLLLPACMELGVPNSSRPNHSDDRIKCLRLILEQPDVNVRCVDGG